MYKYLILIALIFSGCSNMTFNASMCDQIAKEPNSIMPQECIKYNEQEAQKAFDNTKHNKVQSKEDIVEFNKE
ncbi:MAG: hypothetical protein PHS42_06150 [Sulfurimonas sp.]|jgi:PBP1b-binding outer membrane lipoprotein LpoB|nr:hypothetical protein [Sulfurimonas sp.]MDD3835038.1 hypothetical protein [Sulfurimonas sp.]